MAIEALFVAGFRLQLSQWFFVRRLSRHAAELPLLGGNKTEAAFHTPPDAAGFCLGQELNPPEHLFSARTNKGEGHVTHALAILWEVEQISQGLRSGFV